MSGLQAKIPRQDKEPLVATWGGVSLSWDKKTIIQEKPMKDLHKHPGRELAPWEKRMIALRRKTILVCPICHDDADHGRPPRRKPIALTEVKTLQKKVRTQIPESRMRVIVARTVRGGAYGKGLSL
jgi:hypothetical protein